MINKERTNDAEEAIRSIVESMLAGSWHALPCIVQSFDGHKVSAQPAIRVRVFDSKGVASFVQLPVLVDMPVVFPCGGGFSLTFPLAVGDEVLVILADRCIDGWYQSGGVQNPPELRLHNLSDGFAIAGTRSLPRALSNVATDATELRSDDGTVKVIVSADTAKVTAPHVKVHAGTSYSWDVHGYGQKITWTGGSNYTIDNYVTGAAVTTNTLTITPPESP